MNTAIAIDGKADYLFCNSPLPITTMPTAYLTNLDGIRTIAVLLVVVSHLLLQLTNGGEPAFYSFRTMGRVGVAIFFVHTTLVLMASLARHGPTAIPFYVRRIFRIYPLSVAVVLFFALLQWLSHMPTDTGELLSNLFLVQNLTGDASLPRPLYAHGHPSLRAPRLGAQVFVVDAGHHVADAVEALGQGPRARRAEKDRDEHPWHGEYRA
jgi:hypothetical protein